MRVGSWDRFGYPTSDEGNEYHDDNDGDQSTCREGYRVTASSRGATLGACLYTGRRGALSFAIVSGNEHCGQH